MSGGSEKKLAVHMLGGFSVEYGGEPVSLGKISMTKTMELFQIQMFYLRNGVPKNKILQNLYNWEAVSYKNRSLNNLIYRLKLQLAEAGIVQEEYIEIKSGICRWCEEIPTEVDTVRFEECIEKAQKATGDEKEQLLKEAFSLYRGELLPDMSDRTWVMEERVKLKKLYRTCILQLKELLEKKKKYEELFTIVSKAAELYPFDEWQNEQANCLQNMGRYEEAYQLYQKTVQLYFRESGLPPSQKMLDQIQVMGESLRHQSKSVEEIQNTMEEAGEKAGAYYCEYPSFTDLYRLICREIDRTGQSVYLMMCSVRYLDSAGRRSPNAGAILFDAVEHSLRKGDIFTRYSGLQYLILLPGTTRENCDAIFERIRKYFKRRNRNYNCDLDYNVSSVVSFQDTLELNEPSKPISFSKNKVGWE